MGARSGRRGAGSEATIVPSSAEPRLRGEPAQAPLRLATFLPPPCVMRDHNGLTKFSVDLRTAIAKMMKVETDTFMQLDVNALLTAARSSNIDVGGRSRGTPVYSPHRCDINAALLTLPQNGVCACVYDKWFGGN